jgi:phosphoribosylglycinamide formyltransferase-1
MSSRADRRPRQAIVVLISGTGSNLQALVEAAAGQQWSQTLGAEVVAVISSRADAPGLTFAREAGLAAEVLDHRSFESRQAYDQALIQCIDRHRPALVVLAGFMRILTPDFVRRYEGRLVNIHPSLLPAFPGLHTHRRAIEARCQVAGATVHLVTAELDHGPILAQAVVPVLPDDTEQSLAARVLSQEHRIYPQAIATLLAHLASEGAQCGPSGA